MARVSLAVTSLLCFLVFSGVGAGKFNLYFVILYSFACFRACMVQMMDFHWCDAANDEYTVDFASLPMSVSVKQYSTYK